MGVRPLHALGTAISILLGVQVVLILVEVATLVHRINLVHRIQRGRFVTQTQADAADAAVGGAVTFVALVFVATVIVWCVWQHRAQRNAQLISLGTTDLTPGWAVGWWFVPVANLFKPFQAVRELWKASHGGRDWRTRPTWSVIGWWWGIWLASILNVWIGGGTIGFGFQIGSDTRVVSMDQLAARDTWGIVWLVFRMVAAVLAIVIVRAIDDIQAAAPPPSPLPPPAPPPTSISEPPPPPPM